MSDTVGDTGDSTVNKTDGALAPTERRQATER